VDHRFVAIPFSCSFVGGPAIIFVSCLTIGVLKPHQIIDQPRMRLMNKIVATDEMFCCEKKK
jgi:hypothetical protein